MDKNMINIDDLVRQRLSGGEEEERAGAWLRMRELLDKEQPVRVAAGYNWKRMLTYAGGLLLLAAATVGGYQTYHSFNDSKQGSDATFASYKSENKGLLSGVTLNDATPAATNNQPTQQTEKLGNNPQGADKQLNTEVATGGIVEKNEKIEKTQQNATKTQQTPFLASNNSSSKPQNNKIAAITATKQQAEEKQQQNETIPAAKPAINAVAKAEPVAPKAIETPKPAEQVKEPVTTVAVSKPANSGKMDAIANRNFASGSNTQPAKAAIAPEISNPRYVKQDKKVDSINMIATKESSRKGIRKVDTIAMGKLANEKYVVGEAAVAAASANKQIEPAATAPATETTEKVELASLADKKIGSKNYKNKNYNPRRFEEMVQNARMNLSGVSFHPGLMMGVSSTLGSYNMMGMNFGVVGMMDINERWGMFAELKYIYRFGNGKSLSNNYNDVTDVSYLGNNMYEHRWDSIEHSFNITSSSSIELPIAVRYSLKRVNMFVGINTAYNFAVKVDEKENPHARKYISNSGSAASLTSQWGENKKIVYDDFGARFTMGYMLGIGYQLSPAVNFDLRASQPIWDNVKTKGAYMVSKELFRTPSLQVNMTYRFSNNKYKPRTREY
ncbi:hypothetical protein CAP35_11615 [Chitinophagaceae bacterium IBVUCB1]|nr:hypothetical protein CAP35_11615 [Chitinophagaceae bacterium IBVUCB1]